MTKPFDGSDLDLGRPDFLERARALMGYPSATAHAVFRGMQDSMANFSALRFTFLSAAGEPFRHHDLSFGEKRLLTFLYHAACNPLVVIADELVNGLHHEWIETCLDHISDRQSFLATQNPLLLDHLQFRDAEHVRQTFIICRHGSDGYRFSWGHMSMDEAQEFKQRHDLGISHTHEILLTMGLW